MGRVFAFPVGLERGYAPPRKCFDILDQNDAFCALFLHHSAYATYRHSAVCGKVWCLSVGLSVTRWCFMYAAECITMQSTDKKLYYCRGTARRTMLDFVSKFLLRFTRYGNWKDFKHQK